MKRWRSTAAALAVLAIESVAPSAQAQAPPPPPPQPSPQAAPAPAEPTPPTPKAEPPAEPAPTTEPLPPEPAPTPSWAPPPPRPAQRARPRTWGPYRYPPGYRPYAYPPAYAWPWGYGPYRPPEPPAILPYEEGAKAPDGYRLDERVQRRLVIAGISTFCSTYVLSALVGGVLQAQDNEQDKKGLLPLFIPLAGPFVTIGTLDASPIATVLLVVDGAAQAVGAGLFIVGMTRLEKVWIRTKAARLTFSPLVSAEGVAGLGVMGEM